MARNRLIQFMDGPLEGHVHRVDAGLATPTTISRQDPKERTRVYIYRVLSCDGECHAFFDYSERREQGVRDVDRDS